MSEQAKIIYVGDEAAVATLIAQDPSAETMILTTEHGVMAHRLACATRNLEMIIVAMGSIGFGDRGFGGGYDSLRLVLRASDLSLPLMYIAADANAAQQFQSYPDRRFAHASQSRMSKLNLAGQYCEAAKWHSGAKHSAHGGRENRHAERQRNAAGYKPQ